MVDMAAAKANANSEARANDVHKLKDKKVTKLSSSLLIRQEINFAKLLAGNDLNVRNKVITKLKRWLSVRSRSSFCFSDDDFMRLWKGLFYCMWMSDKPLIQEDLSETIAGLMHSFSNCLISIQFFKCFLKTMSNEWFGIDVLRLDKFLMLVRRVLRQILTVMRNNKWEQSHVELFGTNMLESALKQNKSLGLTMHISDIYLEEISKVSGGMLDTSVVTLLLKPFAIYLSQCFDDRPLKHIATHVFRMLLNQSDAGLDYEEQFKAWANVDFQGGNINCIQRITVDNENKTLKEEIPKGKKTKKDKKNLENGDNKDSSDIEELDYAELDNMVKDPRAGTVNVELAQIPFNCSEISDLLRSFTLHHDTNMSSRKMLRKLAGEYNQMAKGIFPLGVKSFNGLTDKERHPINKNKAALELMAFEEQLLSDSAKMYKTNKKREKRELALQKIRAVEDSDNDDGSRVDNVKTKTNGVLKKYKKMSGGTNEFSPKPVSLKKRKIEISRNEIKKKRKSNDGWTVEEVFIDDAGNKDNELTPLKHLKKEKMMDGGNKTANISKKQRTSKESTFSSDNEWCEPLKDGEVEYFLPSRKLKLKQANEANELDTSLELLKSSVTKTTKVKKLVINPFALSPKNSPAVIDNNFLSKIDSQQTDALKTTPIAKTKLSRKQSSETVLDVSNKTLNFILGTPNSEKRVKIMETKNVSQNPREYTRLVKSSPKIPYDANKRPLKTLLKPNLVPSPIDPFYMKKHGLTK